MTEVELKSSARTTIVITSMIGQEKFEKIVCQETIQELLCLYAPRSCMLFVNGAEDDTTTCAFSMECCEVNSRKSRLWSTAHLRKYNFLNIVKTNIQLRFKENIINSIFITLIAGLRDQRVKNTGKHR